VTGEYTGRLDRFKLSPVRPFREILWSRPLPMPTRPQALKLILTALYLLMWPILILALAGDWRWREGWIFGAWFLAVCVSTTAWLYRNDPALLAERYRAPGTGGQSRRDKIVVYLIVLGYVAWIVLMPLDARRFRWTPPGPLGVQVVGCVLLALSWLLLFRSFTENTFLSPLVRIQRERGHRVVTTGVYGIVRHPLYLGSVLMFVGGPLVTGSAFALAVSAVLALLVVLRILDEEKLLTRELAGYDDYRRHVRYRLIPFVW
jgi:protein-S-isoprenylcysteine O-methyltransferase Ste14